MRSWHGWTGLVFLIWLVWLAVTGIVLNHSSGLGLDRSYAHSKTILDAYGLAPESTQLALTLPDPSHSAGPGLLITYSDGQLFANANSVANIPTQPLAGLISGNQVLVATTNALVLLTEQGDLVETLAEYSGLPTPIGRLGEVVQGYDVAGLLGAPVIETTDGNLFVADSALLNWQGAPARLGAHVRWARAPQHQEIPAAVLAAQANGRITWQQVLVDAHAGRLFGDWGIWLTDLSGVALIVLACSGPVLYLRGRRLRRRAQPNGSRRSRPR